MSVSHVQAMVDPEEPGLVQADASMLSIPSRLEWVGKTVEFLKARSTSSGACSPEKAGNLVVALHEAITNAIVHGNLGICSSLKEQSAGAFAQALAERSADPVLSARRVGIRYYFDGKRCTVAISDEGAGFDFQKWVQSLESDPDPEDLARPSGRGIQMMRALVDEVQFRAGGREVELSVLTAPAGDGDAGGGACSCDLLPTPSTSHDSAAAVLLIEQLRQPQDDPRRKHPRVAFTTSVEIRTPDGSYQTAFSRDLSRGGIALVAPFELPLGPVEVMVPIPGRDPQLMAARVVRCQRVTAGVFDIGCQFL